MKKLHIILYLTLAIVLALLVVLGSYLYNPKHEPIETGDGLISTDSRTIHKVFKEPHLIVREWINLDNPQWHKVYYDDPADDATYCWGKEWDEAEDVQEEDLVWHGKGWFIWQLRGDCLIEIHQMDSNAAKVVVQYDVHSLSATKFVYSNMNTNVRKAYTFVSQCSL